MSKKPLAPSRIRYFETHPPVNIRLPIKVRDDLREYAEAHDTTLGKLVTKLLKDGGQKFNDFNEGYTLGYTQATIGQFIKLTCSRCGLPLGISQRQVAEIAERLLKVSHAKCHYCDEEREVDVVRKGA